MRIWLKYLFVLFLVYTPVSAEDMFLSLKSAIKEKVLTNGISVVVFERHDVPVVSFHVYIDAGSSQEHNGITGIAHLLEHLAFKGTKTVGTINYSEEDKIYSEQDALYLQIKEEENKKTPDITKLELMRTAFDSFDKKAKQYIINNEYFDLLMKEGDIKINAYTTADSTQYVNSLPSNKIEFWMAISSDRFINPVFREFYKEKNVVMEERRLSLENNPQRRLFEDFFAVSFKAHPYKNSVIGHMSDLESITRSDVIKFYDKYYIPEKMTIVMAGNVKSDEAFKMAELYFGRIKSKKVKEIENITKEPEQWGERKVYVETAAEPLLLMGYKRPSVNHKDDASLRALASILGDGRTSRLHDSLVKTRSIAVQCGADSSSPGEKYPSIFMIYAVPANNIGLDKVQNSIEAEIIKIQNEGISQEELSKYVISEKKQMIEMMKSNSSMARLIAYNHGLKGSWKYIFNDYNDLENLKTEDIRKAAQKYLIYKNRIIGTIVKTK